MDGIELEIMIFIKLCFESAGMMIGWLVFNIFEILLEKAERRMTEAYSLI